MNTSVIISTICCLMITSAATAQQTVLPPVSSQSSLHPADTLGNDKPMRTDEGSNRNIMLNAESATKPREISIGLPSSIGGTEIYEDGILVGYYFWPVAHDAHWRGGESYGETKTISIGQNAIRSGNVGYAVDSYTKLGEDRFHGSISFKANHYGMLQTDLNVNGPIAGGFTFTAGAYLNFDPGSTKVPFVRDIDNTKIFKVGLTKRWDDGRGEISLLYKIYDSRTPAISGTAPFYYEGDGSVTQFENFRLGRDNYLIQNGEFTYLNLKTGQMDSENLENVTDRKGQDILLRGRYSLHRERAEQVHRTVQ